jgi:hypothetical protein
MVPQGGTQSRPGELLSLVNPSFGGSGGENSGHDIDQSLKMRTSSY